ncbi:MAG: hypothetical protein DLM72_14470 [Candidatus Nitrosopolaris wilkensis]|nr:MAG: hypothetical protein DLM72_14470 [Candidatus Nitrosopolaris wilkensis]
MNDKQTELLNEINRAVRNHEMMHVVDERKVACIFYDELKHYGTVNLGDVDVILKELSDHSEHNKKTIYNAAYFIGLLEHCSES